MQDNDIIKALECCDNGLCDGCAYYPNMIHCRDDLCRDTFDLINRQRAEIERLTDRNDELICKVSDIAHINVTEYEKIRAEAVKEFAEKIDEMFIRYAHLHSHADCARKDYIEASDGTEIEMQSVWDVFTLKKYGIAEYDEMNRLQGNIELIEKGRLLAELEKDLRLIVKEMVGEQE